MLKPIPPFPDPTTPALRAYLEQCGLDPPRLCTPEDLEPLLLYFDTACTNGDFATAVRVLALPLAEGRLLHGWLLYWQDFAQHAALLTWLQVQAHAHLTDLERAFVLQAHGARHFALLPQPLAGRDTPPPALRTAIGYYVQAFYGYRRAESLPHLLACLHILTDLNLLYAHCTAWDAACAERLWQAHAWAEQGIRLAAEQGRAADQGRFLYGAARALLALDEDQAAYTTLEGVLALARRYDLPPLARHAWDSLGVLYERNGGLLEALVCYLRALPDLAHPPTARTLPDTLVPLQAAVAPNEWADLLGSAFYLARDPTWTPPPLVRTHPPPGEEEPPTAPVGS